MARRRAPDTGGIIWPGFVDGLSTLLLVLMFVLSIFVVAQFYLGEQLSRQGSELDQLKARISALARDLSLAEAQNAELERDRRQLLLNLEVLQDTIADRDDRIAELSASGTADDLAAAEELSQEQEAEIAVLNDQLAALRRQLASLQEALAAAEAKDEEQQAQIENLSSRLNSALARRVQELADVRSRFFEALREALGERDDVRVVGDRFVFESDILFGSCSATISPEGRGELRKLGDALLEIGEDIPREIAWILRVDGHADRTALRGACAEEFGDNWGLSSARAISVVQFLESAGVASNRLVAAGFGSNQPLDPGNDSAARARNRRIEFKLTER